MTQVNAAVGTAASAGVLPWSMGTRPLMLAPMQGLTNGALRRLFLERYQPDVVFTEFVRVQSQSIKRIAKSDLAEVNDHQGGVPLVVQLIGHQAEALAQAARRIQQAGCRHINLNLGCPYGRMTTGATGGELLRNPLQLGVLLESLRRVCHGSFSVKCRAGYEDLNQWLTLLPLFEAAGVDFIILHPRTVVQKYGGVADHEITARMVDKARTPIIANGDLVCPQQASRLLQTTAVAGLMIGRGALADPRLFQRIRGTAPSMVDPACRRKEVGGFIGELLPLYLNKFCGERQALMKIKDVLNFIPDVALQRDLGKLKRAVSLDSFMSVLQRFCSSEAGH